MMVTALAAFLCAYLARDILDVGQRNVTTATKRDALLWACDKSWTILATMRDDERDGDANQQEHLANIAKSTNGSMSDHQKRRTIRALLCRLKWKNLR